MEAGKRRSVMVHKEAPVKGLDRGFIFIPAKLGLRIKRN